MGSRDAQTTCSTCAVPSAGVRGADVRQVSQPSTSKKGQRPSHRYTQPASKPSTSGKGRAPERGASKQAAASSARFRGGAPHRKPTKSARSEDPNEAKATAHHVSEFSKLVAAMRVQGTGDGRKDPLDELPNVVRFSKWFGVDVEGLESMEELKNAYAVYVSYVHNCAVPPPNWHVLLLCTSSDIYILIFKVNCSGPMALESPQKNGGHGGLGSNLLEKITAISGPLEMLPAQKKTKKVNMSPESKTNSEQISSNHVNIHLKGEGTLGMLLVY